MHELTAVTGGAAASDGYELQQARLTLSRLERELVEQETGGHALIGVGAAVRVGVHLGGLYGGIVAGGGAILLQAWVKGSAAKEALERVNRQTLIVFELEQEQAKGSNASVDMPPMWSRDP